MGRSRQFDGGLANDPYRRRAANERQPLRMGEDAPNRTLAFLWLLRFCRPAVCDAGLHIPDKMVPAAATLKGLHDLINPIEAHAEANGGQPRGAAGGSSR